MGLLPNQGVLDCLNNECFGLRTIGANYKYNLYLRVIVWAFRVSELRVLSDVSLTAQIAGPKP